MSLKTVIIRYIKKLGMARFQNKEKIKMTKSTTAVNYSATDVADMLEIYTAATTAEERKGAVSVIAKSFGKSVKSVIAKLSREGVYIKAVAATKSGSKIVKKSEIVADIVKALDSASALKSLEKATKADLEILLEAIS